MSSTLKTKSPISLIEALLPLLVMMTCLIGGAFLLPIGGELLICVITIAAFVAGLIAYRYGFNWDDIQQATGEKLAAGLPILLILLSIGVLIGSWMYSGTIPALVYFGIKWINPTFIVLTAFLATSIMSLTGSSWATAGTIGVALMGVAHSVDASVAATAGAIISGAYFGDKLSPLSDTTNICALSAKADLYDHIRNMLYTAGPSFVLAFIVYALIGFLTDTRTSVNIETEKLILEEIQYAYRLSWPVFLPIILVVLGTVKRFPAALAMMASSVLALVVGYLLQDFSLQNALLAVISGFNTSMLHDNSISSEALTSLLNRGGVYSMSNTLILVFVAFIFAGAIEVSGALNKIIEMLLSRAKTVFGLVAATMASGAAMISLTSHGGVTALIVGGLFQDAYKEKNLAPENLSRSLEDSVTMLDPLMPWTVSGLFMATTLGVSTLEYLPWAIFCITGFVFSLLLAGTYAKTGFGLKKLTRES